MKKLVLSISALAVFGVTHAQISNSGLEQWRTVNVPSENFEVPIDWYSADSLIKTFPSAFVPSPAKHIFQTSDANSGSLAAMVMSRNVGGSAGVLPGVLSNAQVGFDLSKFLLDPNNPGAAIVFSGGTPVSQRVGGIKAMTKYTTKATDTGALVVQAILKIGSKDSVVGEGYSIITAGNSYQMLYAPISYINSSVVPTHIIVAFASSARSTREDSSTIYVDDVDFVSVGIDDVTTADAAFKVYPNPAANVVKITTEAPGMFTWNVYNLHGQQLHTASFRHTTSLDVSGIAAGLYTYTISDEKGRVVERGKFNILR